MAGRSRGESASVRHHLLSDTSQTSFHYTRRDIEAIDDFDDAFDIADNMGVDMAGLDTVEAAKQRLIMDLEKTIAGNYKSQVWHLWFAFNFFHVEGCHLDQQHLH